MYRGKRSSTAKDTKKLAKALRTAPPLSAAERAPTAMPAIKPPKKISAKEKKLILEAMHLKKHKKVSKRTNSGLVQAESPPQHIHFEGQRWMHTLSVQNNVKGKSLSRKMSKRAPKKKYNK
jgi:hypothetical protein